MSEPQPADMSTAMLAGLAIEADKLAGAARDLRDTYRFSRQLKVILAISAAVIVVMGVMLGLLLELAAANHTTGSAIKDCTTPTGQCYQRGQDQTAVAVGQIVAGVNAHTDLVLIALFECSRRPVPEVTFVACLRSKGIR